MWAIRTRKSFAKIFDGCGLFLLSNFLVLLLVGGSLKALPRESSTQEVHENVTKSFQIISPRLFPSQMCINAHVTCSAGERFSLSVGNMLLRLRVTVLLSHTEIDHMDDIGVFGSRSPNQEVVWLDISVNKISFMDRLDA